MELAQRLKQLREERQLSQRVLAQRLGCSPSIISSYETGERTPSVQNLVALADLYHVSLDYLFGRETRNLWELNTSGLSPAQVDALRVIIEAIRRP